MTTILIILGALLALAVAAGFACNDDWYDFRDRRNARRMGRPNSRLSKKARALRETLRVLRVSRSELVTLWRVSYSDEALRGLLMSYIDVVQSRSDAVIHELYTYGLEFKDMQAELVARWQDDPVERVRFISHYGLKSRGNDDFYADPDGALAKCFNQ